MNWRDEVVAAARSMVGTPHAHGGRLPGVGLDCGGLIVCTAQRVAALETLRGPAGYTSHGMRGQPFYCAVRSELDEIALEARQPGTVIMWWVNHRLPGRPPIARHLGIWTGAGYVHADASKIVEVGESDYWHTREYAAFDFRLRGAGPNHRVPARQSSDRPCGC